MTRLFTSLFTIGCILDKLNEKFWTGSGVVVLDHSQRLESTDYYLMHQKFPAFSLYDLDHLQTQKTNAIFTETIQLLWNLTREEHFFKQGNSYVLVTAIGNDEMMPLIFEIWDKFKISRLMAINYETDDILFYHPASKSTIVQQVTQLDFDYFWHYVQPNFDGAPLRVVYFSRDESFMVDENMNIIGGQDALAMKTIAEEFNASIQLVETSDGKRYGQGGPNGTARGAFTNLLDATAAITGNTHFLKDYGVDGLKYTHYMDTDRLCLLVPKPRRIPNYVALYNNVEYRWIYLYVSLCVSGLMMIKKIETLLKTGISKMTTTTMISLVLRIFFGVPIEYQFHKLHEKIVIGSFLLATLVLSNCFQCMMTTIASSPSHEKNMNTLSDVRENGVQIIYSNNDIKSYLTNDDLLGVNFKAVSVEESIAASKRTDIGRTHRTYSVFTKKNMFYQGVKTPKNMHIVPECLVDYPLVYVVGEDSTLLEPINTVLSKLVESGLYLKWITDSVPLNAYTEKARKTKTSADAVRNIELYYAYYILGVGLSISSVVFLIEKVWHRKKTKFRSGDKNKMMKSIRLKKIW